MRKIIFYLSFVILAFVGRSVFANEELIKNWANDVQEITLDNGMKFLLYVRGEAPIFSAYTRFKVGGLDEDPGQSGLAHFLEHMAFKGTKMLGTTDFAKEKPILDEIDVVGQELSGEYSKDKPDAEKIKSLQQKITTLHTDETKYLKKEQLAKAILENGGSDYNATTSKDITSYFVSLPAAKLKFWADIESHRIFEPVFREFYQEKDVVMEERRMRVDNDPDGRLFEAFLEKAFDKSPYHYPTIGSETDLRRLTVQDLQKFWARYYQPQNAIGVIVGRLDPKEVRKVLNETFGKIVVPVSDAKVAPTKIAEEPVQTAEKSVVIHFQAQPRILIGYHKPTIPHEDDYVFDLLNEVLGEGRSSRLYRRLVIEKKLASGIDTASDIPGSRLPNLFMIQVSPLPGHSTEEIVKAIDEVLDEVKKDGVTEHEVQKAKNRITVELLWRMKTNEGMAALLSHYHIITGSWRYLADYLEKINHLQSTDIKRVAESYLISTNRTIASIAAGSGQPESAQSEPVQTQPSQH